MCLAAFYCLNKESYHSQWETAYKLIYRLIRHACAPSLPRATQAIFFFLLLTRHSRVYLKGIRIQTLTLSKRTRLFTVKARVVFSYENLHPLPLDCKTFSDTLAAWMRRRKQIKPTRGYCFIAYPLYRKRTAVLFFAPQPLGLSSGNRGASLGLLTVRTNLFCFSLYSLDNRCTI